MRSRLLALLSALLPSSLLAQTLPEGANVENLAVIGQMINWGGIGSSLVLVIFAWLVLKLVDNLVDELGRAFADSRLFIQRLNAFFRFFVYIGVVVGVVLLSFDFSPQILAVIGGGVAVAVGFATRDLVASMVAGVMIVFDRPFQVGDRVSFGGEYGDVLQIGLRSVKLRTLDDSVVTIPNNLFLNDVSSSANFGVLDMQIDTDFYIGMDQDARLASALVREAAALSRYIYLPKPIVVNVEQVKMDAAIALRIRLKAYVLDTLYEKSFTTDVTLRVLDQFAKHGIKPPVLKISTNR
ncbi:mechanosensitive ion channel family protein [Gammaproteobacteria bacterium]|nr:mechanosensitive ion channel family protein [Gammaproteobacteria bacterium]